MHVTGFQGEALTLGGAVGAVQCEVAPPGAVVVPQVMEWVAVVDADGEGDVGFHDAFVLGLVAG